MSYIITPRGEVSMSASVAEKVVTRSLPFTQQRHFRKTLNERVNAYLRENHLPARDVPAMYVKTAIFLGWWLGTYLLLLFGGFPPLVNVLLCIVWAMAIAGVGFNVMHDANHGGYSNHPRINKLLSLSAEMLGMSGFRWRTKHNVWHHTYTNIAGFDDDVEAFGLMRLTPHEPWKPLYKAQAWYFPVIYSFIGFDFIMRDFMMVFFGKSDANHVYPKMNAVDKITFWGGKLFYFTIMFALPLLVFPWWQVLLGFFIVMLTVGLVIAVVFQLAHISGDADFPEPIGDPLHIENEWAMHQVQTTADFAPRNKLLSWYIGGLNYQIEHHLLPHICHLNYPRLAPIVRQTAEEFGMRYVCYPTWRKAFSAHWHELRFLSQPNSLPPDPRMN
jgi:linoleoyl-CoA desaturase